MSSKNTKFVTADEAHLQALQEERNFLKMILDGSVREKNPKTPREYRERLKEVSHELNVRYIQMKGL